MSIQVNICSTVKLIYVLLKLIYVLLKLIYVLLKLNICICSTQVKYVLSS